MTIKCLQAIFLTMQKIITIKTGKNKKYHYDGILFDSKEETYFYWFCRELLKREIAIEVQTICPTWDLIKAPEYLWYREFKTKPSRREQGNLLQSLSYTPDFIIKWNASSNAIGDFLYKVNHENLSIRSPKRQPFIVFNDSLESVIDVKGAFGKHGDAVKFPVLQKIVFHTQNVFVQKIVPTELFKKTFTPDRFLYTDGGGRVRSIKNQE